MWRSLGGDLPLARFCAAVLGAGIGDLWTVLRVTLADRVDAAIETWLGREVNRAKRLFTDDRFAEAVREPEMTPEQIAEHHRQMVQQDAERTIDSLSEDRAAGRLGRGAEGAREIGAMLAPAHAERIGALPELRLLVMRLLGEIEETRKGPWLAGDLDYRPDVPRGRVLKLNAERVKEEAAGTVRWLRPEFQAPEEIRRKAVQTEMAMRKVTAPDAIAWPKDVLAQFIILRTALTRGPVSAQDLSRRFKGAGSAVSARPNQLITFCFISLMFLKSSL